MPTSRTEQKKVETYAQVLLEAARAEGREVEDLEHLKRALRLPEEITSLIDVMSDEGDMKKLAQVVACYEQLITEQSSTIAAHVTTAVELDDDLREKIRAKLEADFGAPVYLVEHVDPSIMGGIIVSARGQRRDASVRTQLQNMRAVMSETATNGGDLHD